jgi:hypothetical protein
LRKPVERLAEARGLDLPAGSLTFGVLRGPARGRPRHLELFTRLRRLFAGLDHRHVDRDRIDLGGLPGSRRPTAAGCSLGLRLELAHGQAGAPEAPAPRARPRRGQLDAQVAAELELGTLDGRGVVLPREDGVPVANAAADAVRRRREAVGGAAGVDDEGRISQIATVHAVPATPDLQPSGAGPFEPIQIEDDAFSSCHGSELP